MKNAAAYLKKSEPLEGRRLKTQLSAGKLSSGTMESVDPLKN
jgi:hypothetical protein